MNSPLDWIYSGKARLIRRKCKKFKRMGFPIQLQVNLERLYQKLNKVDFPYIVLENYELLRSSASPYLDSDGIRILVCAFSLEKFFVYAASCSGEDKILLYSTFGRRGTKFNNRPLFPPALAEDLIESKYLSENGYYVAEDHHALYALLRYSLYCVAAFSKLNFNAETNNSKDNVNVDWLIPRLRDQGVSLPESNELLSIHKFLKTVHWSMALDLMHFCGLDKKANSGLFDYEHNLYREKADKLPFAVVYILREDIPRYNLFDEVIEKLKQKFSVVDILLFDDTQRMRVERHIRGGDWRSRDRTQNSDNPIGVVVAYDINPKQPSPEQLKKAPFLINGNLHYKYQLRQICKDKYDKKIDGLHGNDDPYEAQHMLNVIYGNNCDKINRKLLEIHQRHF